MLNFKGIDDSRSHRIYSHLTPDMSRSAQTAYGPLELVITIQNVSCVHQRADGSRDFGIKRRNPEESNMAQ
jgi:hypothetical protein